MYVDVGVYGSSHLPTWNGRDCALRKFERFTLEHKGYQALYAETLMTYEEYAAMFPQELYEKVNDTLSLSSFLDAIASLDSVLLVFIFNFLSHSSCVLCLSCLHVSHIE